MLFNPDWSKTETKADPFKLETLIAWLEKQPADKEYCYLDSSECLLAQYFKGAGFLNVCMFTQGFFHGKKKIPGWMGQYEAIERNKLTHIPPSFNLIANGVERTFGAALERARKLQASE